MSLIASGAAPPTVQLIGPITVPMSLTVKLILAGALGVALLQISTNGGPYSSPQLALATMPVGSANLVLSTGPYLGDEFYSLQVLS